MKKVLVSIESHGSSNPVQSALEQIICAFGHEIVEGAENADFVLTNSPSRALTFLKESENARVALVATWRFSPTERESHETAAGSLASAFSERVAVCDVIADDEMGFIPFILSELGRKSA